MLILDILCLIIWLVVGVTTFLNAKKCPYEPHWPNYTGWFMWVICILHFIQTIIVVDLGV